MMTKLLKKELVLAMHPFTPFTILFSAMVMIPNYPYSVIFFYVSMAVFFTCLSGRENNDVVYSLNLPVSKRDIVGARMLFAVILQFIQLLVMIPLSVLNSAVYITGNEAGMNANPALFGIGFIIYGVFNSVFFSGYYKNVKKVGICFVKSCIAVFACVSAEVASTIALPFVKKYLDTVSPWEYPAHKLVFLAVCFLIYAALTFITYKRAVVNFEKQDL